jgi:hypothetical protein
VIKRLSKAANEETTFAIHIFGIVFNFYNFSDDTVQAYLSLKEKAPSTSETLVSAYHYREDYI